MAKRVRIPFWLPAGVELAPGMALVCQGRDYKFIDMSDRTSGSGHEYTEYKFSGCCTTCGRLHTFKITGSKAAPPAKCFECQKVQWGDDAARRSRESAERYAAPRYALMVAASSVVPVACSLSLNAARARLYAPHILRSKSELLVGYSLAEINTALVAAIDDGYLGFGPTDKVPRYKARTLRKGLWGTSKLYGPDRFELWLGWAQEALGWDEYPSRVAMAAVEASATERVARTRQTLERLQG